MKAIKYFLVIICFTSLIYLTGCAKDINVVFMDYDTTIIERKTVKSIDEIQEPEVSKVGYNFDGWKIDNISESMITYIAQYSPKKYKISFESIYQDIPDLEVQYDQVVEFPTIIKESHKFKHFTYEGKIINSYFIYVYDKNITVKAVYDETIASYTEFTDFLQNIDDLVSSSKQYQAKITFDYKINVKHPLVGEENVNTTIIMNNKYDKENNYYETQLLSDNTFIGYEILKPYADMLYMDTIVYEEGRYTLESTPLVNLNDYVHKDLILNEGFSRFGIYTIISKNHYQTKSKLGNFESSELDLNSLADILGVPKSALGEIEVEFNAKYLEDINEYEISIIMSNFQAQVEDFKYNITLNMTYRLSKFDTLITPLNYEDLNVYYMPVGLVSEIIRTTDINKGIQSYHQANPHYYKVEFEEGVYYTYLSGFETKNLKILDSYQNVINLSPLWNEHYINYNTTFTITKPGIYYIYINNSFEEGYWLKFIHEDYSQYSDYNNPLTFNDKNSLSIEGKYNYKYYNYTSTNPGALTIDFENVKITSEYAINIEDLRIYIYYKSKTDLIFNTQQLNYDQTFDIPIMAGDNQIIIGSNVKIDVDFTTVFK